MAVLLVSLAVMAILWTVAIPVWRHAMQREKEEELIFRGRQYARAIGLFQRKFANAYPPTIDVLIQQKFLRRKYRDPMATDKTGEFQMLYQGSAQALPGQVGGATPQRQPPGQPARQPQLETPEGGPQSAAQPGSVFGARGGIVGVASKNKAKSLRLYNGRSHYNEWQFLYTQLTQSPGLSPGGASRPGGGPNRPGTVGPGGRPGGTRPQPQTRPPALPGGINR